MNDGAILFILGIVTGFGWGVVVTGFSMLSLAERAAKWSYEEGKKGR